jgi:hypothetical protein
MTPADVGTKGYYGLFFRKIACGFLECFVSLLHELNINVERYLKKEMFSLKRSLWFI